MRPASIAFSLIPPASAGLVTSIASPTATPDAFPKFIDGLRSAEVDSGPGSRTAPEPSPGTCDAGVPMPIPSVTTLECVPGIATPTNPPQADGATFETPSKGGIRAAADCGLPARCAIMQMAETSSAVASDLMPESEGIEESISGRSCIGAGTFQMPGNTDHPAARRVLEDRPGPSLAKIIAAEFPSSPYSSIQPGNLGSRGARVDPIPVSVAAEDAQPLVDTPLAAPLDLRVAPAPLVWPLANDGFVTAAADAGPFDVAAQDPLDLTRDGVWLDQLSREIVRAARTDRKISFDLIPESLGRLEVDIVSDSDGLNISFTAECGATREIVAASQSRLIEHFRAHGVPVSEFSVGNGQQHGDGRRSAPPVPVGIMEADQPHATETKAEARQPGWLFA